MNCSLCFLQPKCGLFISSPRKSSRALTMEFVSRRCVETAECWVTDVRRFVKPIIVSLCPNAKLNPAFLDPDISRDHIKNHGHCPTLPRCLNQETFHRAMWKCSQPFEDYCILHDFSWWQSVQTHLLCEFLYSHSDHVLSNGHSVRVWVRVNDL